MEDGEILELDSHLRKVIDFLKKEWRSPSTGFVSAGIFDGNNEVIATSISPVTGKWIHAERNAFDQFVRKYGKPSSSSKVITTLSPCVVPLRSRVGDSCTDLLTQENISRVHAGILDSLQVNSLEAYQQRNIRFTITTDPYCKMVCANLLALFETYGDRVNTDMPALKAEINLSNVF